MNKRNLVFTIVAVLLLGFSAGARYGGNPDLAAYLVAVAMACAILAAWR